MTREQTSILTLLKKDNKQSRSEGKAYLTDAAPLEAFCAKIPRESAKEFLKRYPTLKAEMDADFEQLCWLLYFRCVSMTHVNIDKKNPEKDFIDVPDTPENKEFWLLLTGILSKLNRLNGSFVEIPQNRVINSFPKTLAIGYQPNQIENTATSIVTNGKGQQKYDIKYVLTNYYLNDNFTDALTPTISALKLFYCLLLVFNGNHSQSLDIPLREYAALVKGKAPEEISASALKDLKAQVVRDLDFLKNTTFDYQEKVSGKWVHSGTFSWNGGTALVKHGHILWNWNTDFIPELERLAPAIYNKSIFTARLNSDEFFFYDLIDKNYRLNEDKPDRVNKIKIKRFLDVCVRIPKYKDVKYREHKKQIIAPFHRILDELQNIEVSTYNENGEPRTTPDEWLSYEEFERGYVLVDYSDYPINIERIENKRAHAKKNKEK